MKKILFLISLAISGVTQAQSIDSLFNSFVSLRSSTQTPIAERVSDEGHAIKCGFGIVSQIRENYNLLSPEQKVLYKKLSDRPLTDTSIVSASGKFRIHFYKSGYNKPAYDINEFAKAADSAYNYEVNILGYPAPPSDYGDGGDDRYDVYIESLSNGYGFTQPENSLGNDRYTSFIVIDNEFGTYNYYTHGIDAARVTIAHELHHAIQEGNYILRLSDLYYHEITSVSMEEFVFPDVDDYLGYAENYFRNPQQALSATGGYSAAIWNLFLAADLDSSNVPSYVRGKNIIKRIWELMPNERALKAMEEAIQQAGSDFKTEFNKFGQWMYFTGVRSVPNKYFKEAAKYPLITPTSVANSVSITVNSQAVSNSYFQLNDNSSGVRDSVVTVVSNCDINGGIVLPVSVIPFKYSLSTQSLANGKKISNKYYSALESASSTLLSEANVFTGIISSTEINYAYPQPFRYSIHTALNFPVERNGETTAGLYIYSIDMNLVYSNDKKNIVGNEKVVWDGLDNSGKKLGTGVYIFVTKSGDAVKKGKFVIYND